MNRILSTVEYINTQFDLYSRLKTTRLECKENSIAKNIDDLAYVIFKEKLEFYNSKKFYKKSTMDEKKALYLLDKLFLFWTEKRKNGIIVDSTMVEFKNINGLLYLDFKDENVRNLSGFRH